MNIIYELRNKQDRQCNTEPRCATTVEVEKQYVLHILNARARVCVCV